MRKANGMPGGKPGSGQPAIVYQVIVDLTNGQRVFKGQLIGHASTDGNIYSDTTNLTTVLNIVKEIVVHVNQ